MLWRGINAVTRGMLHPLKSASRVVTKDTSALLPKRLVHHQQKLPKLPVPALHQTLNKFLLSVRPLLKDDDYKRAEQLVNDFGKNDGVGPKLQTLLQQKAANTDNWLSEWWQNIAYLEFRSPVTIHVSPGITSFPKDFRGQDDQLKYASKMLTGILHYKKMIEDGTLPFDKLGNSELCMSQFYNIVSCCRIPRMGRDETLNYSHLKTKHVCVLHNNHIFSVPVYDSKGKALNIEQVQEQLRRVVNNSMSPTKPVGILTTDHRDNWAKAYMALCKDPKNKQYLEDIHSSIVTLSLDQPMPHCTPEERNTVLLNQFDHGGNSTLNSGNRWADKILQLVVGSDGAVGCTYEHSTAEGPPILFIMDKIIADAEKEMPDGEPAAELPEPKRLDFNITNEVDDAIQVASKGIDVTISDLQLIGYVFDKFGKGFMKQQKCSPDAFIQIAFQLAIYKLYKHSVPTYESGSLRKFKYGRTDTIRSASIASHAYCQAMCDPQMSQTERAKRFREAIQSHRQYTDDVINGQGIDRHLTGLKLIALEHKMDIPEFLMDPIYNEAEYWKLSTSQVASKTGGLLAFAPVVPDGYGVCYNPTEDKLLFGISAWRSCPETDSEWFKESLQEALLQAQEMLLQTSGSKL